MKTRSGTKNEIAETFVVSAFSFKWLRLDSNQ